MSVRPPSPPKHEDGCGAWHDNGCDCKYGVERRAALRVASVDARPSLPWCREGRGPVNFNAVMFGPWCVSHGRPIDACASEMAEALATPAAAPEPVAATEECVWVPAHEPWSCATHQGGMRTSLAIDRCRPIQRARLGHWKWCALTDADHDGPCEAVAENTVIHSEPRPALATGTPKP